MTRRARGDAIRRTIWSSGMTTQILHEAVCKAGVNIRALRCRGSDVYFDGNLIATIEMDEDYRFRVTYSGSANWSELASLEVSSWYREDDRKMLGAFILLRVLILCIQENKTYHYIGQKHGVCIT